MARQIAHEFGGMACFEPACGQAPFTGSAHGCFIRGSCSSARTCNHEALADNINWDDDRLSDQGGKRPGERAGHAGPGGLIRRPLGNSRCVEAPGLCGLQRCKVHLCTSTTCLLLCDSMRMRCGCAALILACQPENGLCSSLLP